MHFRLDDITANCHVIFDFARRRSVVNAVLQIGSSVTNRCYFRLLQPEIKACQVRKLTENLAVQEWKRKKHFLNPDLLNKQTMLQDLELGVRERKHKCFWDVYCSRKLKVLIPGAHYTFLFSGIWFKMVKRRLRYRYIGVKVVRICFTLLSVDVHVSKSSLLKFSNNDILHLIRIHTSGLS